jgi:hypothetical protein
MKTYCASNAGSQIEPVLWNARESVWIISPWLGKDYAERLAFLSQKGIEVRIITSYVDSNIESIEILKAAQNTNLRLLVLDKEKAAFIHAKIYIVDNKYGISGSANLTFTGLNSSIENLSIAENQEEVQKIRNDFMNIWMSFDTKSMSNEELSSGTSHSLRNALPLSINFGNIDQPNITNKELVYHPYYFFEFSFRASAGKSPPVLFEKKGFEVLDGVTRQTINDNLLGEEINHHSTENYVLRTENKYRLTIHQPIIRDFQEARELVLDHIIEENTEHYTQYYRSGAYGRIFVPYRNIVRFIKSGFVQVPIWYIEIVETESRHYENVILGASGRKWTEFVYCPDCQKKIWINEAITCERCGTQVCHNCINEKGFLFKKKLCRLCLSKS